MKPPRRAFAIIVLISLSLACNAITNPGGLARGQATPALPGGLDLPTPEVELPEIPEVSTPGVEVPDVGKLATQIASTVEAGAETESEATPEVTAKPGANPTAKPGGKPGDTPDVNASIRVANALSILLGDQPGAETLPSYHLEVKQLTPVMSGGAVAQIQAEITADVEGANVHFTATNTKPGGKPTATEAYIIGDKNYSVKDGKIKEDLGLSSLAWSAWPINAFVVFGIGSLNSVPAGTEDLDGRTAEVYTLTGASADDPTGALSAAGLPVTNVTGQVWVDQKTGALLKALLDYKAMALDSSNTPSETPGDGRLEITVTQVGQTAVKDPTK